MTGARLRLVAAVAAFAMAGLGCGVQSAFDIENGQCFNGGAADEEVATVTKVDCSQPHEKEVFAVFDYPDAPESYPGDQAIENVVLDRCIPEFERFVGVEYQESTLDFFYLVPTEATWQTGDREIVCAIVGPDDELLTGSMRGANR